MESGPAGRHVQRRNDEYVYGTGSLYRLDRGKLSPCRQERILKKGKYPCDETHNKGTGAAGLRG